MCLQSRTDARIILQGSEPVHFDSGLVDFVLDEERRDLGPLVALQLDDLAHLLVVDEGAVAGEFLLCPFINESRDQRQSVYLLERLQELLGVIFCEDKVRMGVSKARVESTDA